MDDKTNNAQPTSSENLNPAPIPVAVNTPPLQTSINPSSLPPGTTAQIPNGQTPPPPTTAAPKRFIKLKFVVVAILILIILVGTGGGAYLFLLKQKANYYTLLPDDSQFYLSLAVKNNPQVQKSLELGKRFPGGQKMINYLDKNRDELFGQRKDPFEEILKQADSEIFLAKISPDLENENAWSANPLEKLVNIVSFKGHKETLAAMESISTNENVITTQEAYESAKITKFDLKEQKKSETQDIYKTGALPYQVTLPLSKSIYASVVDNFIVSAEKESDIKKILDLVGGEKKQMKSLAEDEDHNEVVGNFPDETLVKFYQRQVVDPASNVGLTAFPTSILGRSRYDTTQKSEEGNNVYTVKRGFSINANEKGFNLASYQLSDKSQISEGLNHGFTIGGSLASRLPASYNSNNVLFWIEVKDLKGILKDQEDKYMNIAQNSSDKSQKEEYERAALDLHKVREEFKKEFGLDVDEDILSWMNKQSAFIGTSGGRGKAPETLAVFEVDNSIDVLSRLSKIKIKDYVKIDEQRRKSSKVKNDISYLYYDLLDYKNGAGNGSFPKNLQILEPYTYNKKLTKQQDGKDYGYLTCASDTQAIIWGLDETNGKYWAWSSETKKSGYMDITPPPPGCNVTLVADYDYNYEASDQPLLTPKIEDYKGEKIYSYPIVDYKGDVFNFRFASASDLVILSFGASDASIKEVIDTGGKSTNSLSTNAVWSDQFTNSPKIVGSIFYMVPEYIFGVCEYFLAKEDQIAKYATDDYVTIAKGYLKTMKSIGATTTQKNRTLITDTNLRIEAIDDSEAKKVEKALDNVFFDRLEGKSSVKRSFGGSSEAARDAQRKNDIGALATELQGYYTTPGQGKYPKTLDVLVEQKYLKQLPKDPDGSNYFYLTCKNEGEIELGAKLESEEGYWVYRSAKGIAEVASTIPNVESCESVLGVKAGNIYGIFESIRNNTFSPNR